MILAGDVGGTHTRLCIFDEHTAPLIDVQKFPTGNGAGLEDQIAGVLKNFGQPIERACLAIAGPVIDGNCRSVNIGREFKCKDLQEATRIKSMALINDLVANASGIELLKSDEVVTLLPGQDRPGSRAVVSPGTGLGEALLPWDGRQHRAFPSEGGHARFAPTTPDERGLLDLLMKQTDDVLIEHVASGRGIEHAFDYWISTGITPSAAVVDQLTRLPPGQRVAMVSAAGVDGSCPVCSKAMELYIGILAIECASMAVRMLAVGGIYLGGGIPPKILPLLKSDRFRDRFLKHVTMGDFLQQVPVRAILNDDTALEGAALYGVRFGRV